MLIQPFSCWLCREQLGITNSRCIWQVRNCFTMTEPNVFGEGAGKDEGRADVPQVSHAPQLRGEGLIKVQGRASKLWAAQNPGK